MCGGKERVDSFLAQLEKRGVNPAKLAKLPAYQKLIKKRATYLDENENNGSKKKRPKETDDEKASTSNGDRFIQTRGVLCGVVVGAVAMVIALIHYYELHTHHGFAKFWLRWENLDLHVEQCTIEMPPSVQDVFRPPVECDMCRQVTHVERVHTITPSEFEERYAYSGRPVVVTDGQKNWTAPQTFSFEFFKSIYADDSPVLENFERDCQFFPYQTEFRNLRHVFNMSEQRANMHGDPWYIGWSNCDSSAANILRGHYERPYFLPQSAESSKTDWIFIGTPGYGAHLHIDHVGNPSWQAQIRGRKLWTLEPPPECYFHCVPMEVVVEPGEIIVLDTNIWYHKTLIVSEDLSITIGSEYD
ncbi:bifunctional arginine demethylase and lysyl-hydroxylase JMJD6-like [Macrobrachium rosenbergii]|uniref:bifunctional arginine demethylase and lysyl-hydroxylase JMJD6-like n=1 Tax=Macrobrachium rosenbergii TaxID=79674 RepID=UPI0034D3BDB0